MLNPYMKILSIIPLLTICLYKPSNVSGQKIDALRQKSDTLVKKRPLEFDSLGRWKTATAPSLSYDGKYVAYFITNEPVGKSKLFVKELRSDRTIVDLPLSPTDDHFFNSSSTKFFFHRSDSLYAIDLRSGREKLFSCLYGLKVAHSTHNDFIAYKIKESSSTLTLQTVDGSMRKDFQSVKDYDFNKAGDVLFVESSNGSEVNRKLLCIFYYVLKNRIDTISEFSVADSVDIRIIDFILHPTLHELTLTVERISHGDTTIALWQYNETMHRANECTRVTSHVGCNQVLSEYRFTKDGKWIFFTAQARDNQLQHEDAASRFLWTYRDLVLPPEQLRRRGIYGGISTSDMGSPKYQFAVDLTNRKLLCIASGSERLVEGFENNGDFVVLKDNVDIGDKYWWKQSEQPNYYVRILSDSSIIILKKHAGDGGLKNFSNSPDGRFLVFWDNEVNAYFCLDMITRATRNISKDIPTSLRKHAKYLYDNNDERSVGPVAAWCTNNDSFLLYDQYDIWQVDPFHRRRPRNITHYYGQKYKTRLQLVYGPGKETQDRTPLIYSSSDSLLLVCLNERTFWNGFMNLNLRTGIITPLFMGPYTFYITAYQLPQPACFSCDVVPMKARDSMIYLVQRQSAAEAPNFFCTKDFHHFQNITQLNPSKNTIWYSTELLKWKMPDGQNDYGILYKPDNFDATKQYPLIVHIYKQLSQEMYQFQYPFYMEDNLNIPWFVSNGYLVFVPDIYYSLFDCAKREIPGESALKAVLSGLRVLSKRSYIDMKRIGIQGHSVGGMEVNYIISHTRLFGAAAEFAGVTDPLSNYLTLVQALSPKIESADKLSRCEITANETPWARPDLYGKASAVLHANNITTPLLITHNPNDNQIQYRQGVELFMALRRLGKRVWFLQYNSEEHSLARKINKKDYTRRLTQFFDFYLKKTPPPLWMTHPSNTDESDSTRMLEFDTTGELP